MKTTIGALACSLLAGACAMALSPSAKAQDGQTAEGAQSFLALMAERGLARATFVDALGRPNHVIGTYAIRTVRTKMLTEEDSSQKTVERSLGDLVVTGLEAGSLDEASDACSTRIAGVEAPADVTDSKYKTWQESGFLSPVWISQSESWDYTKGFAAFAGEHAIDWRQAKVARSNDGARIEITAPGRKFKTHILAFVPGDTELGDRIEYAAKFLRMSCDETAATGF